MIHTVLASFALVAISEMGDKTQLLAFALAARFRKPGEIMAGILVATMVNHALASWVGTFIALHVPPIWMASGLGIAFLAFGIWTLFPDRHEDDDKPPRFGAFVTTIVLFFLAEMGDKTQLATMALAARYQSIVYVTLGTTLGMMFSDGLAVFIGEKLAGQLNMNWVRRAAACVFMAFAAASFWEVFRH